ncbi:hypothetical protein RLIN73S_05926 [Rhodanobacter lindaniclasticus]
MRLSTIKLAGFKSFVDPTTLHAAQQHDRRGRPERLRQVQHHRRDPLGDGRERGQPAAWRLAHRRDLLWLQYAQAGGAGHGGADLRQRRRLGAGRVRPVRRDLGQAPGYPRRPVVVLPQWRTLSPARHHRPVPRHWPRSAQLLDHRAGHDLADHRGASGGTAHPPGGGRRHLQVQGAPQGNRKPHQGHPRKPRPRARRARRGGQATGTLEPPAPAPPSAGSC